MSLVRHVLAAVAALAALVAVPAQAATVVEFYHRSLDHYFVTGLPSEIEALDSGRLTGWARTGLSFETFPSGDARLAGSAPVCRFLGNPARGLTSHFYSAFTEECTVVKTRWPEEWRLETDELFRVHLVNPVTGLCPAGTRAVHRLWNGRADTNHRYTTERSVVDTMVARGYVAEGSGNPLAPVVFCAADVAPPPPAAGTPACTIASGAAIAVVGSPVTLTATCTNAPTTFAWSGCTPTGNTCVATATAPGRVAYALAASNAAGAGAQARIELDWQLPSSAAPVCSIVASSATPQLGTALTLTANCSQSPSQFQWMGCSALLLEVCNTLSECSASSGTCRPIAAQSGLVVYALIARNSAGASPKATVQVEWTSGGGSVPPPPPPSPTPSCVITPSSTSPAINTTLTLTASCTNSPTAWTWTGCSSTTSTCTTTESVAVTRNYSVSAQNAAGLGFPAQISVTWQSPPTAPPVCTISASTSSPFVGASVTLTANCTQSPTGWQWTGCSSSTSTCTATSGTAGPASYSVVASNQFGPGPAAATTLNWASAPPPGADLCGSYGDVIRTDLPWGGIIDTRDLGGLRAGAVIAARMRVPTDASSAQRLGQVRFYEYIDGPADRQLTVSTSACDFRGFVVGSASRTDPTSATAPMAWSNDQTPALNFAIGTGGAQVSLVPGQTYYFNLRNLNWASGANTCQTGTCNGRFQVVQPN
jgi:hypothetical protein